MIKRSEKRGLYLMPEKVDRKIALPVYQQICDQLRKELVLNGYRQGERFYSYRRLGELYKVEPRTITAALEPLLRDGLLIKRAASGI
ncbi:MAG: GntR family transcriptional regulator, partial [Lentisphaeria bacterium]|nr:GntR family transcriptional regulator [Lentisphaeria bacterium]